MPSPPKPRTAGSSNSSDASSFAVLTSNDDNLALSLSGLSLADSGAASAAAASPAHSGAASAAAASEAAASLRRFSAASASLAGSIAASLAHSGPPLAHSGAASPGTSQAGSFAMLASGGSLEAIVMPAHSHSGAASPGTSQSGSYAMPASGGSFGMPAHSGAGAASQSDFASVVEEGFLHHKRNLSLEDIRALRVVSSRLPHPSMRPVPEHREIGTKDLPDPKALAGAVREVEACLKLCQDFAAEAEAAERENGGGAGMESEDMALGATACPEGGQVAPQPAGSGDVERVRALLKSAQVRMAAAMAEFGRLESRGGDSPASGGFAAAPPAEDYDQQQWSDAGSTLSGPSITWSAPARLEATPTLGRAVPGIPHHPQY